MNENELSRLIIGASIDLHRKTGPGLLESVYEEILFYELTHNYSLHTSRQVAIPVVYEEVKLEIGFRADLIVENKVIIDNQISRASYRRTSKTTTDLLKIDQPKAWPLNKFQ